MNDILKLPFTFIIKNLIKDLIICSEAPAVSHFNTENYIGEWESIPLRSLNGDPTNIYAHKTSETTYKDCQILNKCNYFQEVINLFKCEKEAIRLLNLKPNSFIKLHTDDSLSYQDGFFRIHIPITTNNRVIFHIDDIPLKMNIGETWYVNFNLPHKVENTENTERVHIVMDCIRNDWSDELFEKSGYDFSLEKNQPIDKLTLIRTIEELKFMKSETSIKLIETLEKQLKSLNS